MAEADDLISKQGDNRWGEGDDKKKKINYQCKEVYSILEKEMLQYPILSKLYYGELISKKDCELSRFRTSFFRKNPFWMMGIITAILGLAVGIMLPLLGIITVPLIGILLTGIGFKGLMLTIAMLGVYGIGGMLASMVGTLIGKGISLIVEACSTKSEPDNRGIRIQPTYGHPVVGIKKAEDFVNVSVKQNVENENVNRISGHNINIIPVSDTNNFNNISK